MTKLEGRAQRLMNKMQEEGKVKFISPEATREINHEITIKFSQIKKESERLQINSYSCAIEMEYKLNII